MQTRCRALMFMSITAYNRKKREVWISVQVTSGFEQVCTRPPIRLCVKSAAVASSRSTGARKAVMYAQRITTALWALCHTLSNKRKLSCACYKKCLVWWQRMLFPQSPDVNPIQCPSDAFCPAGSLAPSYCMETFFRKAGDTCEFAPVTIALLVIGGGGK